MKYLLIATLACFALSLDLDCGAGAVSNNQGVCVKPTYIEGCYQYASSTKCFSCSFNYVLGTDGKCQYQIQASKPCCLSKNPTTGVCQKCQNGLFLLNGKCQQKRIIGCLSQDQKGNCLKCSKSFYLETGSCKKGVLNCAQYISLADIKICDQCQPGHSLLNNTCLPNSILGCKSQVDEICTVCYDPFIVKDNHCQVQNCQSHNQFGCVACECGYFLTSDRKCNQISQGCIRYTRGICNDCMQHFQLKGGVCDIEGCLKIDGIKCSSCKDGYESTQLGCKLKNCLISKEGLCEVCQSNYHQREGLCIQATAQLTQI